MSKLLKTVLVLLAILALIPLPERADAQAKKEQGWTVWQGNHEVEYAFRQRWTGQSTPSGFTFSNAQTGVTIYYYGTFRVEHRSR